MTNEDKRHVIKLLEGFVEMVLLTAVYYCAWTIYRNEINEWIFAFRGKILLMVVYAVLILVVFKLCDCFNFGNLKIVDAFVSQAIAILIINVITYFQLCLAMNRMLSVGPMAALTIVDFAIAFACVYICTRIFHNTYIKREMVFIYGSDNAKKLADKFSQRDDKYHISKSISCDEDNEKIFTEIDSHSAVIINDIPSGQRGQIIKYCYENRKRAYLVPSITDVIFTGTQPITLFDTPLRLLEENGFTVEQKAIKRFFDILLSLIAMIPCSLVIGIIALAIKIEDGGPVFYKQKRLTTDYCEFEMYKFRSMIVNAEAFTGAVLATENDPRITKVGTFLRRHRLDELPQIINIIKGDMSIVGPRPERKEISDEVLKTMPEFAYRTKVKGGLTGYAQVYGKYNTTPYDKLKMDLMYIENYTLLMDIKIVLLTPQILFRKESTEGVQEKKE